MHEEEQAEENVTIPQMVEDVRFGKMPRRHLISTLTAMGISAVGVGAIVAATAQQHRPQAVPAINQNDNTQQHLQLHNQHITHQSQGNTGALHADYAEHAIVEDTMYREPLIGRAAIMSRKGMGMAAIPDLQIKITNRVAHGNQVSRDCRGAGDSSRRSARHARYWPPLYPARRDRHDTSKWQDCPRVPLLRSA